MTITPPGPVSYIILLILTIVGFWPLKLWVLREISRERLMEAEDLSRLWTNLPPRAALTDKGQRVLRWYLRVSLPLVMLYGISLFVVTGDPSDVEFAAIYLLFSSLGVLILGVVANRLTTKFLLREISRERLRTTENLGRLWLWGGFPPWSILTDEGQRRLSYAYLTMIGGIALSLTIVLLTDL